MKAKTKVFVFIFSFWLLSALLPSYVPSAQASSPEWIWRWDNPYTLSAYREGDDVVNSTFFPTPQVFWNGTQWLNHSYEEREGYYVLRNSHIAVEVYDYYAKFYDVNYSEVRLHDERWEVQRWRPEQGSWEDVQAQSGTPTYTVVVNESGVWLTKSFTSWAGMLNISYALRKASPLKHTVVWKSSIAEETEFRIVQRWSGIVGGKVKHAHGEQNVTGPVTVNSTLFSFMKTDGTFTVLEDLWDTGFLDEFLSYHNYVLKPTTIDVDAQGMKADFTFQNSTLYTIPKDGTITLDPQTSTMQSEEGLDGCMYKDGTTYPPTGDPIIDTGSAFIIVGQLNYSYFYVYRGYLSFMTTTIPNNATIEGAKLVLKTAYDYSDQDFRVYVMGGSQPIYGDKLEAGNWSCGEDVIESWYTGEYPGNKRDVNLTIAKDQINKRGRTQFELMSSRDWSENAPTGQEYVIFYSADSPENEPRLEVSWKLQTETVGETGWYYLNASNNKAAIVLDGGLPYSTRVEVLSLYNDSTGIAFKPYDDGPYKDKFIEDLHASGFDIMALGTNQKSYSGSETWVYDATMWLREQGYQHISLFGFSGGGVVIAYEIQKDYAGIWHAAVIASAPVDWKRYTAAIYHSAHTASKTKVPVSFITSPDDDVANYSNWPIYKQMQTYYNNTVVHKEWHCWYGGHSPFPYTCRNHTGETVAEATANWYLKVFDVAITSVIYSPFVGVGCPLDIKVVVKNEGNFGESFNVTVYYGNATGNYTIGTQTVINLASGAEKTLTFIWNTIGLSLGNYTIKAEASVVPGETDTADNTHINGIVRVMNVRFTLVTLYMVNLYVNETFNYGSSLKVRFYSYEGIYQGEVNVWSGATPANIILSVDVTHPNGLPVQRADLVITDESGTIVETVTIFLVRRPHLFGRIRQIIFRWAFASAAERITLFKEIVDISKQWPYTPA